MAVERNDRFDDEALQAGGVIRPFQVPLYDDDLGIHITDWSDFPEDDQDKAGKPPYVDPRVPAYQYNDNSTPPPGYWEPDPDPEREARSRGAGIMDRTASGVFEIMGGMLD